MDPKHYKAHISTDHRWTWDDLKPRNAMEGMHVGEKQRPILQRGDTLVIRVGQNKGPHTIVLSKLGKHAKLPFAYPFDLHSFDYNPDTDVLVCAGLEDNTASAVWSFNIRSKADKEGIDPEFQVGPGGISEDDK